LNIRTFKHPFSVAALALFALAATPALHASSACPTPLTLNTATAGTSGTSGEGFDQGYLNIIAASPSTANITCNVLITIAANGSISTSNPNGNGFYDTGGDDNVVGVINNSSSAITSLNLSSATFDIFGFDGDGVCGFPSFAAGSVTCGTTQGSSANNNYLPGDVTATNISASDMSGTINFIGGIAPGGTGFFSLEDPVDLNLVITPGVPEPGTLLMMGTGIAGFAGMLRRKFAK
jgi:hypothetical protein